MHFTSFWIKLKWSNYLPQLTTWLGSGTASWIKGSRMTTKTSFLLPHIYLRGIFFTQINHDIYNFLITLRINVEGCRVQKKSIATFSLTKFSGIDFVQEFFKHQGLVKLRYLRTRFSRVFLISSVHLECGNLSSLCFDFLQRTQQWSRRLLSNSPSNSLQTVLKYWDITEPECKQNLKNEAGQKESTY